MTVLGQPDLSSESEVDAGGKIVVALAGAIDAAGHTVGEVEEEIRNRYAGSIPRDPKVAIQVIERPACDGYRRSQSARPVQVHLRHGRSGGYGNGRRRRKAWQQRKWLSSIATASPMKPSLIASFSLVTPWKYPGEEALASYAEHIIAPTLLIHY